ncbi:MAG: transglutaminase domain-containing protein [Dehalococcoidia bacterium]|nr:transglutaminase domain-containing protein [Dehalococcoidia bacterium]
MAHAAPTFEEMFLDGTLAHPERVVRSSRWFVSVEAWVTLALLLMAQLPVVGSLETASWVEEMPSLLAASLLGLGIGWVLAQSPLPGAVATLLGVPLAIAVSSGMVLQRMVPTELDLGVGWKAKWTEFALRMREWGDAVWNRGISADPLPFVVLLVLLVFLVGYLSAWAVVRWRNAWVALIPGGVVLLTNISYLPGQPSLAFIAFLLASVMLVTRMEFLRSVIRWRREQVQPPDLMSMEVLAVGAVVAVVLVSAAWVVPTADHWGPVASAWDRVMAPINDRVAELGDLFVGVNSKKRVPAHSFGPLFPLQGKMTLDATPVLEVTASEPGNLRGAVYDEYTGAGWKLSLGASAPLSGTTVQAAEFGTPQSRAQVRKPVTAKVKALVKEAPDRRLLSVGDPLAADVSARQIVDPNQAALTLVPNDPTAATKPYTTVGTVSAAAVPTLQAAGTQYPPGILAEYTALPVDFPEEIRALAKQVIGPARTPYEATRRVENFLRANHVFTLDPPPAPPRKDAVAAFLFDQRAGYFDQFASAMAVMLRSAGIPTRVATGFVLDPADVDSQTKAFMVSEIRAWAWPEVYFPGLGWVEFNPTPTRGLVQRAGDDSEALAAAAEARDAGALNDNLDGLQFEDDPFDSGVAGAGLTTMGRIEQFLVQAISVLIVLSMVAFVLAIATRVWWERRFAGLSPATARWGKVQQLAAWAGVAPPDYLTPAEAARALAATTGEPASLATLAREYTRGRYGVAATLVEESAERGRDLDREYARVRGRLRRLITRRVLHLGRVDVARDPARLAGRYAAPAAARR